MKLPGNVSAMTRRQHIGFWLVHVLAWLQAWVYAHIIRDRVWRSADGRCTPVRAMTDNHVRHALRMILRQGGGPWAEILCAELVRRGLK